MIPPIGRGGKPLGASANWTHKARGATAGMTAERRLANEYDAAERGEVRGASNQHSAASSPEVAGVADIGLSPARTQPPLSPGLNWLPVGAPVTGAFGPDRGVAERPVVPVRLDPPLFICPLVGFSIRGSLGPALFSVGYPVARVPPPGLVCAEASVPVSTKAPRIAGTANRDRMKSLLVFSSDARRSRTRVAGKCSDCGYRTGTEVPAAMRRGAAIRHQWSAIGKTWGWSDDERAKSGTGRIRPLAESN